MRWLLLTLVGALAMISVACGSGGDLAPTGTQRSERDDRQTSISQQRSTPDEPHQLATANLTTDAGVIDFGHRQGLPFQRNVVGDPDAPVLIVEYSDFQ